MRQNPLRLYADTAKEFQQSGQAQAFRDWLSRNRSDLSAAAQQALVRHLARAIDAFGAEAINAALDDLPTFERRLRMTVDVEPGIPSYATKHWKRAVRHFYAAAHGLNDREVQQLLALPRQTLAKARRMGAEPIPVQQSHAPQQQTNRREAESGAGSNVPTPPTIAQLVKATRTTWRTLVRAGDTQPETPDQLIEAQLSCLSTQAKVQLLTEEEVLAETVPVSADESVRPVDLMDRALAQVLHRRLGATDRATVSE